MNGVILKRFERPDEVREFPKGRFEIVRIGGMTIGRASYEPGWKWGEHVGPGAGAETCRVEHVGLVLSGRCAVKMDGGREFVLAPGDLFHVAPGHDSWVVGDEPYVSLHFVGSDQYAKKKRASAKAAKGGGGSGRKRASKRRRTPPVRPSRSSRS